MVFLSLKYFLVGATYGLTSRLMCCYCTWCSLTVQSHLCFWKLLVSVLWVIQMSLSSPCLFLLFLLQGGWYLLREIPELVGVRLCWCMNVLSPLCYLLSLVWGNHTILLCNTLHCSVFTGLLEKKNQRSQVVIMLLCVLQRLKLLQKGVDLIFFCGYMWQPGGENLSWEFVSSHVLTEFLQNWEVAFFSAG